MKIAGTYPMLFAFFDEGGALRADCIARQVAAARACGAEGVAVLGLATEVAKLGRDERQLILTEAVSAVGKICSSRSISANVSSASLREVVMRQAGEL